MCWLTIFIWKVNGWGKIQVSCSPSPSSTSSNVLLSSNWKWIPTSPLSFQFLFSGKTFGTGIVSWEPSLGFQFIASYVRALIFWCSHCRASPQKADERFSQTSAPDCDSFPNMQKFMRFFPYSRFRGALVWLIAVNPSHYKCSNLIVVLIFFLSRDVWHLLCDVAPALIFPEAYLPYYYISLTVSYCGEWDFHVLFWYIAGPGAINTVKVSKPLVYREMHTAVFGKSTLKWAVWTSVGLWCHNDTINASSSKAPHGAMVAKTLTELMWNSSWRCLLRPVIADQSEQTGSQKQGSESGWIECCINGRYETNNL